ncbi:serine/threonine-protein phosphatase 4 regulatory subunit 2-A [Hoplias malabaricus]|uniref:serine/threonine-protein phosphatase 4 regulatory subunit 2-A n=1 Tax=Hoplias malabaricus TaxID=27720 RepID=UPI0034630AF1
MEIDTLLSAFRDFEKKGKKETCPVLDQFLCHIAKTGETVIQWSQFKSYFLFKLEKVMDDFKASSPEQRGPANPNVEYIPYEEMKERILKIVDGYNGIPFTIQRLCELLTEPKRNYTGTDKFLRGVEKNVMVVSCVYPTSEKNGSSCVNRMNGVMFPGNASAFSDRNVNGPGTPRPVNRPKLTLSSSVATNGLPDSTDNKEQPPEQTEKTEGDSLTSEAEGSSGGPKKSKHHEDEDSEEELRHDSKRLKFDEEEEEEEEDEEKDKEENVKEQPCPAAAESSSDVPESSVNGTTGFKDTNATAAEDQEPSSTQPESADKEGDVSETENSPGSSQSQDKGSESDPSEQHFKPEREEPAEEQDAEKHDPVSSSSSSNSSSSSSSTEEGVSSAEPVSMCPSSSTEPAAEGSSSTENSSDSSETADDPMEQD